MSELYELPDGWEWKKLDEFTKIKGGKRIPKGKKLLEEKTKYPYIRVADFNDFGSVNISSLQYITEEIFNEIKNYTISNENIYISIAGTIGKTGIIPNELEGANLTENAAKIVFDNEEYSKYYLLYFTKTNSFLEQVGLATKVVAMPKLALTRLKNVFISLPPLKEQKRIVSKLDTLFEKIDKAIELHEKNIKEADAFMGSVLNEVFEELEEKYGSERLDSICEKITDGTHKSPKTVDSGYPYITVRDVNEKNLIDFNNCEFINEEDFIRLKAGNCAPLQNDVLFSKDGTVGKVTVVDFQKDFAILSSLAILRPSKKINSFFLFYAMKNPKFLEYAMSKKTGAAIKRVVLKTIKEFTIPLVPINIQQKTVEYLDKVSLKIEKTKAMQKEKLQNLKDLKASILDQAFKGEL